MTKEEFAAIGQRCYGLGGTPWKHSVARAFGRSWNTVWCYADGRHAIPQRIAEELRLVDRLFKQARAKLDAETEEQKRARLNAFLEQARLAPPLTLRPPIDASSRTTKPPPPRATEIARLRAAGCRNADIATKLGITKKAVADCVSKYRISPDGRIRNPSGEFQHRWTGAMKNA